MTGVSVRNVMNDLAALDENTSTGEYGYIMGDDGRLYIEVWNDNYHGVKLTCRVGISLEVVGSVG